VNIAGSGPAGIYPQVAALVLRNPKRGCRGHCRAVRRSKARLWPVGRTIAAAGEGLARGHGLLRRRLRGLQRKFISGEVDTGKAPTFSKHWLCLATAGVDGKPRSQFVTCTRDQLAHNCHHSQPVRSLWPCPISASAPERRGRWEASLRDFRREASDKLLVHNKERPGPAIFSNPGGTIGYRSVSMNTSQPISPNACLILFFALSAAV
jgi:hypothetical protein